MQLGELRRKVIIEGEERGVRQTTESVNALSRAHVDLGRTVQLQMMQLQMERRERQITADTYRAQGQALRDLNAQTAANSNHSDTFKNVAEGSLAAAKAVTTLGAAYLAWRGFSTALAILRVGGPVLAGLSAANVLFQQGAQLVDQYADAHRKLDRADLASNLETLTRFQKDTISAAQVRDATELGARLQDANFQISQFFKVHLDLTDPALKLQRIWVNIAEAIGRAATKGGNIIGATASAVARGVVSGMMPGGGLLLAGYNRLGATPEQTLDQARQDAVGRLGAALGNANLDRDETKSGNIPIGRSFSARWNAAMYDLSQAMKDEKKEKEAAKDAWDRATESISKHTARLEADALAVGQGVEVQARLRAEAQLTEAAQRAGIQITGKYADQYRKLADAAGAAALSLERARIRDSIAFDRNTMFLPEGEKQIAGQLRGLYGSNVTTSLQSSEAAALRFNQRLVEMRDLSVEFAQGFTRDFVSALREGVKGWEAFSRAGLNALQRLSDKLIDKGIQGLINSMFAAGAGGGEGIAGFIGSAVGAGGVNTLPFGGPRAEGGPVAAGVAYKVGEHGTELFVPGSSGHIVPNGGGGGGGFVYAPTIVAPAGSDRAFIVSALARERSHFEKNVMGVIVRQRGRGTL